VAAARSPFVVLFGQKLRAEIGVLECGLREPRLNAIIKLAGALEVPLGELFRGNDWKSEEGFVLPGSSDVPVE
jgi:transcriptional regulator with XRE-family HTH domain